MPYFIFYLVRNCYASAPTSLLYREKYGQRTAVKKYAMGKTPDGIVVMLREEGAEEIRVKPLAKKF